MVLSVATQKGGTGKTTTSISIAAGLAHLGKKVLLVDVDSQANSSKVLLPDFMELDESQTVVRTILQRQSLPILPSHIPNLSMVSSHFLLAGTDVELTTAMDHREARLKARLDEVKDQFDHVIIDCPPALGWLTINAFTASNRILIVVSPGYFELDSIVQIGKTITQVQQLFNPGLQLAGILFTQAEATINSRTSLKILRQTYTDDVCTTVIPRNTAVKDANFNKKDIFTYAPQSKAAYAYSRLIEELKL